MTHTKCLINFYRSFDLSSLARIDCCTNYNQVIRIISAFKNNQYFDFQYLHGPCNALKKRKDDSNTNFERGENNKELDLGEMIISLEKLFENSDIDDI